MVTSSQSLDFSFDVVDPMIVGEPAVDVGQRHEFA
jgi:hypothetical protein